MTTLVTACVTTSPPATPPPDVGQGAPPSDRAAWSNGPAIEAACAAGLDRAAARRDALRSVGERTPQTVLSLYNEMLAELDAVYGMAGLLANVHPDKTAREAGEACERKILAFISDVNLDRGMYEAVATLDLSPEDSETKRFAEKVLREFRRAGVDKDDATRAQLKQTHEQMVEVGQTFSRNIREDVRKIYVAPESLKGLPKDWLEGHAPNAEGKVEITTNYPDYFPVQQYAEDEAVRRQVGIEFLARGYPQNEDVLKKLLGLRQRYARLLGYSSWADYNAGDKMVKSSEGIAKFIGDLTRIARPRMERDVAVLIARKKKDDPKVTMVQDWDRFYYVDKVRAEQHGIDAQSVRPYFEYVAVTRGLMDLYGELFGVRFQKDEGAAVWHASVAAYDVYSGDERIARFYLDMHPRDGKYGHAAMFPLETGIAGGRIPSASLVCNFPNPAETKGPALMGHDQVVTYFHEFGHLVHHLLARRSRFVNQGGITVEMDFVEAPSQLLEEWAWDPAVLARFAKHVETGAPISADVVKKMRASSEFGKGVHVMRQLFLTALSYTLHVEDPDKLDLTSHLKRIQTDYMPYPYVEGTYAYANFGHLDGYSSMYYTYQWSLVLAKDIFTRFEKAGLLDASVARDYREKILAPGGMKDASELVRDFLGRESNLEAYRRWLETD